MANAKQVRVGLKLDELPTTALPDGLAFLLVPESLLQPLATNLLPKVLLRDQGSHDDDPPVPMPGVLGQIDQ